MRASITAHWPSSAREGTISKDEQAWRTRFLPLTCRSTNRTPRTGRLVSRRQNVNTKNVNMGAFYETIPESMIEWIRQQKMFFVATAPLSACGHVNVSP